MKILIKNMVCRHCVETVSRVLSALGVPVVSVELGAALLDGEISDEQLVSIDSALQDEGFQIIRSREAEIVEGIKRELIACVQNDGAKLKSVSSLLAEKMKMSYATLSRIFTEAEGRSIENYHISLRVERVKELIKYQQLTLSEIADMTGYSSVAHLSRQFKQTTGLTPTQFQQCGIRRSLPDI